MSMIYIGIDNGLTGGLVAISSHPGPPIDMIAMPTRGKSKGNEVDAAAVCKWIGTVGSYGGITIIIEIPGKFSKGIQAVASMHDSFGALRSICEVFDIRHHRVTPQAWQKYMLVGCAKGDTKPAALARVKQLWPNETWLRSAKCTKPHDGMIDAALIAEYGRVRNL